MVGNACGPFILIEATKVFNVDDEVGLSAALALECVHCYSLIHDDLPAMDNDDLRRGKQHCIKSMMKQQHSCSDALLTLAFEFIAKAEKILLAACLLIAELAQLQEQLVWSAGKCLI